MSYQVEIQPSGHRFEAQEGESLLEAALRAGLNIQYNCNSGSCGECRARILEGEVRRYRHGDFHLSEAEQLRGGFLLCTHVATSDLRIEALEAGSAADIPLQQIDARVRVLESRGEDMRLLTLRTPRTRTLRFLAGQHVHLAFTDGDGESADLALAGCPCNGMELEFHIARDPASPFAERLFRELQRGDTLHVEGPYGEVTLDEESVRPLLFIAVGEGFAFSKSLIEHELALESGRHIEFWWLAGASGHYRANLCRSWEDAVDELRYRPLTSAAQLQEAITGLPGLADYDIYLSPGAGSDEWLAAALLAAGAESERIFISSMRSRPR